jgi:hypothetical protein
LRQAVVSFVVHLTTNGVFLMTNLYWTKSTSNTWLPLNTVNLSTVKSFGVYIIWHSGNPGRVVRVGQGNIADRVGCHKTDREVLSHANSGQLYVTWATTAVSQADGIERFLAEKWKPLVGKRFPDVLPIAVNSPW